MIRFLFSSIILFSILSCADKPTKTLKKGLWRATLEVMDNEILPFIFEVKGETELHIYNDKEVIVVDEINYKGDSVNIKMPVFQNYIAVKFLDENNLSGIFINPERDRIVTFNAEFGNEKRYFVSDEPKRDLTGNWEMLFSPRIEDDEYIAKGIFKQQQNKLTGTIRTTTGDYRYLEGVVEGEHFELSTFDGSHAFLFTGTATDSTLQGMFYSGNHFKEPFIATRNENYELPNENELTFLKEGYDKLAFTFPDAEGNLVSLEDDQFKNKVVIVQLMGTWCPNCLDETKFYSQFYRENTNKDLEIVALAFEYAKTNEIAVENIKRYKEKANINYPILLAQIGGSSKVKAQEKLPMLNHVWSYPTSVFIDKKGKVRKIHTGFNGPATGEKYDAFKTEFYAFVNSLLEE
ncbi:TlpA disulfide reductase family protein [Yeosuana sp. MJ-SS3]|uniref:TlpA disulfide reductase family protein n=1 Tax=Gilvirhabdus luticola TaxID=3079858 RepID=A0ABU3U8Y9_9FLAO|nr:TlpA disulfide reductase family protein [Yeosuana sp. MJ-SS3]MDU8886877.1 TlpA disulfide reductase family protein [Yeosuana sp. MJ-SS3]